MTDTRTPFLEENDQTRARRDHLEAIRALVGNAYPNKFDRSKVTAPPEGEDVIRLEDTITSICEMFKAHEPQVAEGAKPQPEQLQTANDELNKIEVRVSGRIATPPRVMGKAAFVHLSDGKSRLQIYVRKDETRAVSNDTGKVIDDPADAGWQLLQFLDHGDFIGVAGFLFVTKTGELSVHVKEIQFLSKALVPMPDKMHGISDPEIGRRQRYVDLIASSLKMEREPGERTTREVFELRSKLITQMRSFLDAHGYVEVETPMLTPIASGAAARPFETFHKALGIKLYARIAPELYLKRLLVGGFERVYELNRNFRNEGIGYRWNPEFTMLEFYCAYMDVNGMMDFCEEMLRLAVDKATDGTRVRFGDGEIDFGRRFERVSMREMVKRHAPDIKTTEENLVEMFEAHAESHLTQPTFIIDFPKAISPLSKASPADPSVAERFELYVAGMEIANGFSELNDPVEQYERFEDQTKQRERGDDEAMQTDLDYVRALSYGMPPAAGIGIGIDRLTMLLTDKKSIRDVILFPHMRPQAAKPDETAAPDEKEGAADGAA
jgi:lysyl-tRNA synthetase class 2